MSNAPDFGEIMISGKRFKLGAPIQPVNLTRFPAKVTFGDYTVDSNDILSSWIINDLTGGHGVSEINAATDQNRYRIGTINTRYPKQFAKPFKITATAISAAYYPIGNFDTGSTIHWYSSRSTDLYKDEVDTTANLAGVPVGPGVPFQGTGSDNLLFIPLGSNGYATWKESSSTLTNVGTLNVKRFISWDDKLIAMDTGGQLWYITSSAGTFTSYGDQANLPKAYQARDLVVYQNAQGDPCVIIVADEGLWAFDASAQKLHLMAVDIPPHPYSGLSAVVWRGELFIACGMDIVVWNGSVQRNVGLSRDNGLISADGKIGGVSRNDGIPYQYQGRIVHLQRTLNSVYALVRSDTSGYTSLHEWSSIGWRMVWSQADMDNAGTGIPTFLGLNKAQGSGNRLVWGLNSGIYCYQDLPVSFTNPREAIAGGSLEFGYAPTGVSVSNGTFYFETGRWDAAMQGYRKIANAVEVDIKQIGSNDAVNVYYKIDFDTSWTKLNSGVLTTGHNILPFGALTAYGIYPGVNWEEIELKLEITNSEKVDNTTSLVENMVCTFMKIRPSSYSWVAQIDCTEAHDGLSPENQIVFLQSLADSSVFLDMKYLAPGASASTAVTYRWYPAQTQEQRASGFDTRGQVILNLLEIPLSLDVSS